MSIYWFVIVTFVILIIESVVFKRWVFAGVQYQRYFNTRAVYEGESVEMVEQISNRKLLPIPWMKLESMIHANLQFKTQSNLNINRGQYYQNHKSVFSLTPFMQIVRRHQITCLKRGSYSLDTATMTSGDLLGIQSRAKAIKVNAQLLVYPKIMPMRQIALPSHSWQGDIVVRRWIVEDPFLISGVRDYRYGDTLNHINWKATARAGKLQVNNRDFTADHRLMIYVNFEDSEQMWDAVTEPELIEKSISIAASVSQYGISQGIETGFGCNGYIEHAPKQAVRIPPRNSREQLMAIYETMARLEIARSVPFDTLLEQDVIEGRSNTDYLLITSYVSDNIQNQINQLKRRGNAVEILQVDKEHAVEGGESA